MNPNFSIDNNCNKDSDGSNNKNNPEDINNPSSDFYLDSSLIDLNIIKRIGIEKSSNSLIVEAYNQIIVQTIHIDDFSDKTIKPLRKQLSEIIEVKKEEEKQRQINSIITCINRNIGKISEYSKENSSSSSSSSSDESSSNEDENNKIYILVNLALNQENTEKLFKDQYDRVYAAVRLGNNKHLRIFPIDSTKYKRYLSKLYRENTGSCISDSLINSVITNLAAEAEFNESIIPLHLRVAWGSDENGAKKECIYYDMCDNQARFIEISKDSWRIINGSDENIPILFKRFTQQAQVEPDRTYPYNIFEKLLNLTAL